MKKVGIGRAVAESLRMNHRRSVGRKEEYIHAGRPVTHGPSGLVRRPVHNRGALLSISVIVISSSV